MEKATSVFFVTLAIASPNAPTYGSLPTGKSTPQDLTITVHGGRVVRREADRFFGIDLNYIRDADVNRSAGQTPLVPLRDRLKAMGVRWLRFPGGEKSNYHLWAAPPYDKPAPRSLAWYATVKGRRMDFDEFVRLAKRLGAEPYVVAGYESEARTGLTKAQWLATAVAWVRYANVTKKYGIRYWEIGNENWNHKGSPAETARIVVEFSRAMKAVDPTIHVGASGDSDRWWKEFLPLAGPDLDFLSVSQYTGWAWGSYDHFLAAPSLTETVVGAERAIDRYAAPAIRAHLRVIVAETNTKDYSNNGWRDANDLGHALVTFATLGHLVMDSRVAAAIIWTTRWMNDTEAPTSPFYALGARNELMPTGQALAWWGRFIEPEMVATEGNDDATEAFAARSRDTKEMTVWILNRSRTPRNVHVKIDGPRYANARRTLFTGHGDSDRNPASPPSTTLPLEGDAVTAAVPPLSVTVLTLK